MGCSVAAVCFTERQNECCIRFRKYAITPARLERFKQGKDIADYESDISSTSDIVSLLAMQATLAF